MSHSASLIRQWKLLLFITQRRFGTTIREMAEELGVSQKMIRRDLETFRDVGFAIREEVVEYGRKRYFVGSNGNQVPPLSFKFDEALALYLGRRFLEPLAGTPIWTAAQHAFGKIRACLDDSARDYVDRMLERFCFQGIANGDYSKKTELIDQLLMGIEDRKEMTILYQSAHSSTPIEHAIHPYGIVYHRGSLYLVAFSCRHERIRHFKLDRAESADRLAACFEWPDDFNLEQHLARCFGVHLGTEDCKVKVRFSPTVAQQVSESRWHASQTLFPQSDGSLIVEFQLSSIDEIKAWILSFGQHATALEPESLRAAIRNDVTLMSDNYEEQDPSSFSDSDDIDDEDERVAFAFPDDPFAPARHSRQSNWTFSAALRSLHARTLAFFSSWRRRVPSKPMKEPRHTGETSLSDSSRIEERPIAQAGDLPTSQPTHGTSFEADSPIPAESTIDDPFHDLLEDSIPNNIQKVELLSKADPTR